jgi:hypothetical protein
MESERIARQLALATVAAEGNIESGAIRPGVGPAWYERVERILFLPKGLF